MLDAKEKLIQIRNKLTLLDIGDLPDDPIEQDIFAELDLLTSYIHSKVERLQKESKIEWDLSILEESYSRLKKFINQRGNEAFRQNKILFAWYTLCIEAIQLMKELSKK